MSLNRRSMGSTILLEAMTFSCGAGRKRQRGQTRRPWAGCCCGKLLLSFASSAVTHTHTHTQRKAARERNTHISSLQVHERCVACTPTDRPTDGRSGRAGRRGANTLEQLWLPQRHSGSRHRGAQRRARILFSRAVPSAPMHGYSSLSLSFYAYSARERSGPALARLRFHGRARPLALLCGPTYADVARPPACLPARLPMPSAQRLFAQRMLDRDPSENNNPLLQLLITFMPICSH
jgi:hypothetical protein